MGVGGSAEEAPLESSVSAPPVGSPAASASPPPAGIEVPGTRIISTTDGTDDQIFEESFDDNEEELAAKAGHPHAMMKGNIWGQDDRLCGGSLVVPREGLSLLFWGGRKKAGQSSGNVPVFTSRYARTDHDGVYVRCVESDPTATSPGILLETKESHPLAYLSTDYMAVWCGADPKDRSCAIFRNDLSLFAIAHSKEDSNKVNMMQRENLIASICVDFTGTHANVLSPTGHLLGNVIPNDEILNHPIRPAPGDEHQRVWLSSGHYSHKGCVNDDTAPNRIVNLAPGVDAGLVLTLVVAALQMEVGNL